MDTQKPNDIFAAILQKPDANVFDLTASNVTSDNTELLTPDQYKQSTIVQNAFKDPNGKFDDAKFNAAYLKAADLYTELDSDKTLASALQYDPLDFTAPVGSQKENVKPTITPDFNPFRNEYSISGINSIDESNWSYRQIAQQSDVWDTTNKKWLGKSAADLGLFGSLFGSTLVYAQWDDNGTNKDPITGNTVKHQKGEWKYNSDGNLYVETLGDRDIAGKQVVNPTDLITKKGTWLNSIDFFDSDGKNKSVFGTTMKMAAEIAPYFLPFGAGEIYAGFKLAMGMADIIPTLYKAGEGLFSGDSKSTETKAYKAMTATQGFLAKFNTTSMSDAAQQSIFNYEQLGNSVADIFGLINQQRAAAKLASLFYKSQTADYMSKLDEAYHNVGTEAGLSGAFQTDEDVKAFEQTSAAKLQEMSATGLKQSKLAKNLGLGFMALSQATPIYNEAIQDGYDKRTAAFASLLACTGQYVLMDNSLGTWMLDKSVGYSANELGSKVKDAVWDAIKSTNVQQAFEDSAITGDNTAVRQTLGEAFGKFKNKIGTFLLEPHSSTNLIGNMARGALIQGVEMSALTASTDMAKGITDLFSNLGLTGKKGSFGGWNNVFSDAGYKRYLSSFIGGLVGGPIFELERTVITPALTKQINLNQSTEYSAEQGIADGLKQQMFDYLDKNVNKIGNSNLSPLHTETDGKSVYLAKDQISQGEAIVTVIKQYLNNIDNIMHSENLAKTDNEIFTKAIINQLYVNDLKKSNVARFMISDFRQKSAEIIKLNKDIEVTKADTDAATKESSDRLLNQYNAQLEEKRQWVSDFFEGKKANYYHQLSLFVLSPALHSAFSSLTPEEFTKSEYNENYDLLDPETQKTRKAEFDKLFTDGEDNYKNKMKAMFDAYLHINHIFSPIIADYDKNGYASIKSRFYNSYKKLDDNVNIFSPEYSDGQNGAFDTFNKMNADLKRHQLRNLQMDELPEVSLGDFLVDRGFIEQGVSNDEQKALNKEQTLELAKHYNYIKEPNETDEEFVNRVQPEIEKIKQETVNRYNAIKLLKELIPDYETRSVRSVVHQIQKNNTLHLWDKEALLSLYSNYLQATKENTLSRVLTNDNRDGWNQLGLIGDITDETVAAKKQTLAEKARQLGSENAKRNYDEKTIDIHNHYQELLDKRSPFTDPTIKEHVVNILNSMQAPNAEFNKTWLQEQLHIIEKAQGEAYTRERAKLFNTITDPKELDEQLQIFDALKKQWPNIKLKKGIGTEFDIWSPKRELILKYAEDVIKNNEGLDNETINYLKNEKVKLLQDLQLDANTIPNLTEEKLDQLDQYKLDIDDKIDAIDKVLNYKNIQTNSLLEKLRIFEVELFGNNAPISIFKVLDDNMTALNSITDINAFKRVDLQIYQLQRALNTIIMVKSVLAGMSSRELGAANRYGFNVSLNKSLEEKGEQPIYATISDEAGVNMLKDLTNIENKLKYLSNLAHANASTMITHQAKIQKVVVEGISKQILNPESKISLINLKINNIPLLQNEDVEAAEKFNSNPEQKLNELESRAYRNFHALPGTTKEKLDTLFNAFFAGQSKKEAITSYITSPNSELTENFKELTLIDWYNYIHYMLAYDSKNSYLDYKNNVKKEVSLQIGNQKAPLFIQQRAIRETLAYIENKEIVQHIIDFLQPDIEDSVWQQFANKGQSRDDVSKEEFIQAIKDKIAQVDSFPIKNIIGILGSGGVGKSSVIANWVIRTILNEKKLGDTIKILAIAPTDDTLKILTGYIGNNIDHSIESSKSDDFFKKILTQEGYALFDQANRAIANSANQDTLNDIPANGGEPLLNPKYFIKGQGDGAILLTQEFLNTFVATPEVDSDPILLVADEMSKFTTLEWQLLNHLARKPDSPDSSQRKYDNYYIILAGDDLQNGVVMGKTNYGMENILLAKTTKLKVPIRGVNIHQNEAAIKLEKFAEEWRTHVFNSTDKAIPTPIPPILNYYDDTVLKGPKFIDKLTLEDLKKIDPTKQVVILSDDRTKDADTISMIQNYFKTLPEEQRQEVQVFKSEVAGREFDQVIILAKMISNNPYFTSKNIYTLLTRGKETTLIVGTPPLDIKGMKLNYFSDLTINPNIVKEALETRLNTLENLTKDYPIVNKESAEIPSSLPRGTEPTIITKFDLPEIIEDSEIDNPLPDVTQKKYKTSEHSDNITFGYSFFNNLGVAGSEIQQRYFSDPSVQYIISDHTDLIGTRDNLTQVLTKTITWEDLQKELHEYLTGTDLFSLPYNFITNVSLRKVLSNYIAFKNRLLFSNIPGEHVTAPDNYLGNAYTRDPNLYIKELAQYSDSYGKLVGIQPFSKIIKVLGTYITVKEFGKDVRKFITLASLPDITNPEVINGLGKIGFETWSKIYKAVENNIAVDNMGNLLKELPIDSNSLSIYGGVQVPRDSKTNKTIKLNQPLEFKDLADNFPGVVVSDLRVFREKTDSIRRIITAHDQTKVETKDEKRNWEQFRFKPYVTISYVVGEQKFGKVVVLEPKARALSTLWEELKTIQEGYTKDKDDTEVQLPKSKTNSGFLLSDYRGWEILRNFLNEQSPKVKDLLIQNLNDYFVDSHGKHYLGWEPFRQALEAIKNDPDITLPFRDMKTNHDFLSQQHGVVKSVFLNAKDTADFYIGNPIFMIHRLWSGNVSYLDTFKSQWDQYLENHKDDIYYYNAILTSVNVEGKGADYGTLSEDQHKYYTLNYAVESNRLKIDISRFLKNSDTKTEVQPVVSTKNLKVNTEIQPGAITKPLYELELPTLKWSNLDSTPIKFNISEKPLDSINENTSYTQIYSKISSNTENKEALLQQMNSLAVANIRVNDWEVNEENHTLTNESDLDMHTMLTNLYNEDSYIFKKGKWILNLGEDYKKSPSLDASEQKTTCK